MKEASGCLLLSCFAYSSFLKKEAIYSFETKGTLPPPLIGTVVITSVPTLLTFVS
jgi:hypothetical protein